jgi:hypothetical protein
LTFDFSTPPEARAVNEEESIVLLSYRDLQRLNRRGPVPAIVKDDLSLGDRQVDAERQPGPRGHGHPVRLQTTVSVSPSGCSVNNSSRSSARSADLLDAATDTGALLRTCVNSGRHPDLSGDLVSRIGRVYATGLATGDG